MIDLTDKYKTVSGLSVTVYSTTLKGTYPVLVVVHCLDDDSVYRYTLEGKHFDNIPQLDLVKLTSYDHLKIDDKVLIWNDPKYQHKGYFAGVSQTGRPLVYRDGKTSWTSDGWTHEWNYCELAE